MSEPQKDMPVPRNPEEAALYEKLAISTSGDAPEEQPKSPPAATAMNLADEVLKSTGFVKEAPPTPPGPPMSPRARNLDLSHNDNAFHVLADLVVKHFNEKKAAGVTTFTQADRAALEPMMTDSVRLSFVEAVRYRLVHNCPADSETNLHILTRQCRELGLDQDGERNPLLATTGETKVAITNMPPVRPPSIPGREPKDLPVHVLPGENLSVAGSTLTGASASDARISTAESLARQQLMAELRDASKFMAESKTPDAAKFWKEHVVKLQARLRSLHNTEGSPRAAAAPVTGATAASQILESNRRMLGEYPEEPQQSLRSPPAPEQPQVYYPEEQQPVYAPPPPPQEYVAPPPQADYAAPQQDAGMTAQSRSTDGMETVSMGQLVDVVAPANLPGGYNFEAEIQGKRFLATVPAGGVRKGETFSCVMRDLGSMGAEIPVGGWRDRLCDCGIYGFCHAVVVTTLCCPLLTLGQIMSRVSFDFLGRPLAKGDSSTFGVMGSIVTMWVLVNLFVIGAYNYKWSQHLTLSTADIAALGFVNVVMLVYAIYAVAATRSSIREKFMIREQRCYDLEDCCCATFCMPCTVCQMARHTADYNRQEAVCFSSTGLPDDASSSADTSSGNFLKGKHVV